MCVCVCVCVLELCVRACVFARVSMCVLCVSACVCLCCTLCACGSLETRCGVPQPGFPTQAELIGARPGETYDGAAEPAEPLPPLRRISQVKVR